MKFERRTHTQTLTDAIDWARRRASAETPEDLVESEVGQCGINNYSELIKLPEANFDIIRGFPHEIMHILMNLGTQIIVILRHTNLHELPFTKMQPVYCAGTDS